MKRNKKNHEAYLKEQTKRIENMLGKETRESRRERLQQERKSCSVTFCSKKQRRIDAFLKKEMLCY